MNIFYIDGNFADSSPGPFTRRLMARFTEYSAAYRG